MKYWSSFTDYRKKCKTNPQIIGLKGTVQQGLNYEKNWRSKISLDCSFKQHLIRLNAILFLPPCHFYNIFVERYEIIAF